ncbi:MAG: (2Fe-2S)-binding protein, partial [Burkholderiaceae bacterium]|nr:(2Fe-2S)-binding protein [Burkholderiaceae bacterium]
GGPLLWYVAEQLRGAGAEVAAVLSFTPLASYLRHAGAALRAWRNAADLTKGARWMAGMHLGECRVRHGVRLTGITGSAPQLQLHYEAGGTSHVAQAATVLLHADVIPNTQASKSLALGHIWDPLRHCWQPQIDAWGVSSCPAILVAGDGAGIAGARDAARGGTLVALGLAARLGRISLDQRDARAAPLLAQRAHERKLRAYFDRLFAPPPWVMVPADDATVVCRCEVVTADEVRAAARLGAHGPNQVKAYVRAGMGACQGRMCAHTVAAVIADELGIPAEQVPTQRVRPPLKPVHLGDLAAMDLGADGWTGRSANETLLHAPCVEPTAADRAKLH